ncbi:uncharacterized protein LOC106659124 isoform X1 [Trichogramma pretiosum]|uniref:uncharacterized protein LOC106659124 isoform X1 n=1 Tax=Trichogramma pretiosum TaxID=7493 RepID=UPI0006C9AAA4|nr:uncharacterized protein LOC106659124 isoform X1 [Trichogramma pretiosum]
MPRRPDSLLFCSFFHLLLLLLQSTRQVSAKLCDGGHVCTFPKECCSLGCCSYTTFPQIGNSVTEMLKFLFWYYWYLWIAVLVGLVVATACGCWLCRRRNASMLDDGTTISERASLGSCYLPPHYSRCSSIVQAMPPPYNEVTAKPDLYPLVIGYGDDVAGPFGKGHCSGLVMRYFRSLSHASTLDSLSSSFMCNVVNSEANNAIPPPYSCNNSIDELSSTATGGATGGAERPINFGEGSLASLVNHRTTSDVSSLAAQSPLSPPRATSPTIELRELLDKIQQLPQLPSINNHHNLHHSQQQQQQQQTYDQTAPRPSALYSLSQQRSTSPQNPCDDNNDPSGDEDGDDARISPYRRQRQQAQTSSGFAAASTSRTRRTRGKTYVSVGHSGILSGGGSSRSWLSRSAPTTPSGVPTGVSAFLYQHHLYQEAANRQQAVPLLLAEQEENEQASANDAS